MSKVRNITPVPPANFTPEAGNYKTLQPFRYWCQKVLPLVYDDSLSYYELLCKVVDYLNKTMEDVETLHGDVTNLHTAYEELQNYVNNYFSTLDVQEEINNKLDTMASDGTLANIINEEILGAKPTVIGCILRPTTDINKPWVMYSDENHIPKGISGIEIYDKYIRVIFDKTYKPIISFNCTTDESLTAYGLSCSASVSRSYADIYISGNIVIPFMITCNNGELTCTSPYVRSIAWENNHINVNLKNVPAQTFKSATAISSASNRRSCYINIGSRTCIISVFNGDTPVNAQSSDTFTLLCSVIYSGYINTNATSIWDSDILSSSAIMFNAFFEN